MIKTKIVQLVRGQTMPLRFTAKDLNGVRVDLTGAQVYFWIRADMKVDAVVKLASQATAGHRVGIEIQDQTGAFKGDFIVTIIPEDTADFVALGASDPYLYDAWVVLADASRWPVVSASLMPVFAQVTDVP